MGGVGAGRLGLFAAAVAFSIGLSAGCVEFGLRQDVESARLAWSANPGGGQAAVYAEALHDAFTGRAYAE